MKYGFQIISAVLFLLAVVFPLSSAGQGAGSITVVLKNEEGAFLKDAVVHLRHLNGGKEKKPVVITNGAGEGIFHGINYGDYRLLASYVGLDTLEYTVKLDAGQHLHLELVLKESVHELSGLVVRGKSEMQQAREQPVKAVVVNTREAASQAATLTELINRTAGVRIRQTGGVGSAPDVSVNGFQGRAVRYFKDGIPLDYLRDGYNIASVPVNMLDRVEVYKGVLPVTLGADALGGAVNLVTRRDFGNHLHLAYEAGSFNTHRASVTGKIVSRSEKVFAGADLFFNHSDNDYTARVKVTDPETRNQVSARLRMFHNAFTGYYGELYGGVMNTGWTDELRIGLAGFSIVRQQQHPALMTDPYGAILGTQSSAVPTLRYKKAWNDGKVAIDQFLVYNTIQIGRTDTLRGRYDWYGHFTPNLSQLGESRQPSLSDIDFTNFTSRTNLRYGFSKTGAVEINYVITSAGRIGSDPLGPRFSGSDIDVLSVRTDYRKQVLGAGIENVWWDGKITNQLMGKFYSYYSAGADTWASRPVEQRERITKTGAYWGVAEAVKLSIGEDSFVRLSAEAANRLPQQDELFGDGIWIVPNFNLNPERSFNFNLGYHLQNRKKFTFETNAFFRHTRGMILLIPIQPPYAQYTNMENVRGFGLEADGTWRFKKIFSASANFTWQNLRLFGINTPLDGWKNGTRLRNTPWFFANLGLHADLLGSSAAKNTLKGYAYYNFMKEYYLETIPKRLESQRLLGIIGSARVASDLVIPTQHLVTAGVNYGFHSDRMHVGLEVKNILDNDLYDYYRIQKAGRSFHLKATYSLK